LKDRRACTGRNARYLSVKGTIDVFQQYSLQGGKKTIGNLELRLLFGVRGILISCLLVLLLLHGRGNHDMFGRAFLF